MTLWKPFMIMEQQDTLEKLGPIMQYDNITGGQDFEHL